MGKYLEKASSEYLSQITLGGNTAGVMAGISTGSMLLAGGNNVTLSQDANSVTISAGVGGAAGSNTMGMSNLGNSSGTSGVVSGSAIRMLLAGGNNVTLSQSLDGVSGTITISAANTVAQSVQTQNMIAATLAGNTAGALALVSSGTLLLAGGNNITLSQAGNAVTLSGPTTVAQSVQTQNLVDVSLSGNTAGVLALISSGTAILAGGNNITLSQDGQSFTISAFNQSVQTQNIAPIGTAVKEVQSAGSTGTITRYAPEDHAHAGINLIRISGNTSNTSNVVQGSFVLAGGNNVTLSQVTAAGAATVTVSAANQTVQTQNLVDVTLSGNTAGALALISSGTLTLAGGNNITLSQAGNAITISAGAGGAAPTLTRWCNMAPGGVTASVQTLLGTNNGTINVFPLTPIADIFAGNMTASTVLFNFSLASANTSAQSWTFSFGIYTAANSTALSLLYQATTAVANAASSNNTTGWHGFRWLSIHSSRFSNSAGAATTPSFADGSLYFGAYVCKSSGQTKGASLCGQSFNSSNQRSGTIGAASQNATSLAWFPWNGIYSSGSLPTAMSRSSVNAVNASSPFVPMIIFENEMSAY